MIIETCLNSISDIFLLSFAKVNKLTHKSILSQEQGEREIGDDRIIRRKKTLRGGEVGDHEFNTHDL